MLDRFNDSRKDTLKHIQKGHISTYQLFSFYVYCRVCVYSCSFGDRDDRDGHRRSQAQMAIAFKPSVFTTGNGARGSILRFCLKEDSPMIADSNHCELACLDAAMR